MPLITGYQEVKAVYQEAAERGAALPMFCAEDRETLEAILASALEFGKQIGVDDLPIIPAWTVRYPERGQMTLVTAAGSARLGVRLMFSDLAGFMSEDSPYRKLRVLPHLDHGFPWLDGDIMEEYADRFASVMCDASERPFDENIHLTAQYVDRVRGRVVVEGAVDEIVQSGDRRHEITTVAQARSFLDQTGVDILVPNLGTEHHATAGQIAYRSDRAREISAEVGKILCLHGSSSVRPADLPSIPHDGIMKVNIYTTLAVAGGQAVARQLLRSLGSMLSGPQLAELAAEGILAEPFVTAHAGGKPILEAVANTPRRDAWFEAVRARCGYFLKMLNYQAYAR